MVEIPAQADTVDRVVRVGEGQRERAAGLAGVEAERQCVAAAEQVLLRDRGRQHDVLRAGKTRTQHQVAGGTLLDGKVDVDLVGGPRDRRRFDGHLVEEAKAVNARARTIDRFRVVPAALHLAHLATHDLVARLGVATDVDAAHIHPSTRIDKDREGDLALDLVDFGGGIDVGEGVTLVAEAVGDRLGGLGETLAREGLAGTDLRQRLIFGFGQDEITGEAHAAHRVLLALGDVHRDVDVLLVRRDRHLRGVDVEVEIALVQVEGAQGLEVRRQLLAGVLVVLGVPGQPAGRGQLHLVEKVVLLEGLRSHDPDLADLGHAALVDLEVDADAVALERGDGGGDRGGVLAARQVLALELLLRAFEQRTIEDARLGEADLAQPLLERILVEFLDAVEGDVGDRRALVHHHDDDLAFGLDAHIAEEAGGEQRADGVGGLRLGEGLADADRQVVEDGARLRALDALDADVLDHEGIEGEGRRRGKKGHQEPGQELAIHAGVQPEMRRFRSL